VGQKNGNFLTKQDIRPLHVTKF